MPYVRNAGYEAARVTALLQKRITQTPQARPVLAFVNPKKITIKDQPGEVKLIDGTNLRRWLMKRPQILTPTQVEQLAAVIDDPASWRATEQSDTADLMGRFTALNSEVRAARIRNQLWQLVGVAAVLAGVCSAAWVYLQLVAPALAAR